MFEVVLGFVRVLNIKKKKKTRKTRGRLIPPGGAYNRMNILFLSGWAYNEGGL